MIIESDGFGYIFHYSKVITIALEPYYCGGVVESLNILKHLGKFFKKKLDIDVEKQVKEKFKNELKLDVGNISNAKRSR